MTDDSVATRGLVSVVIPAHNASATLARALRSVAAQTYRPIEVIVVDDGSVDGTSDIARQFRGLDTRVFRSERPGGASAARNKGIELARGEFVAFLDADDEWLPEKTAAQIEVLDTNDPPVFVSCEPTVISYARREVVELHHRPDRADGPEGWKTLLRMACVATPSVVVRRTTLAASSGFNTELKVAEDQDLWIRLALTGPVRHLDQQMVRVYNQAGGLMDTTRGQIASITLPMVLRHLDSVGDRLTDRERRNILAERYASAARDNYRHNDLGSAVRLFGEAVKHGFPLSQAVRFVLSNSLPATIAKRVTGFAPIAPRGVLEVAAETLAIPRLAVVLDVRPGDASTPACLRDAIAACRRHSIVPTCLVDEATLSDRGCVEALRAAAGSGDIEVGVAVRDREPRSFSQAHEALTNLTDMAEARIGVRPRIALTPWFTNSLPKLLEALDYAVDLSVRPFTDGRKSGHTDLSSFGNGPFRFGNECQILEVPVTHVFSGVLRRLGPAVAPLVTRGTPIARVLASTLRGLGLLRLDALTIDNLPLPVAKRLMRLALAQGSRLLCASAAIGGPEQTCAQAIESFASAARDAGIAGASLLDMHASTAVADREGRP